MEWNLEPPSNTLEDVFLDRRIWGRDEEKESNICNETDRSRETLAGFTKIQTEGVTNA